MATVDTSIYRMAQPQQTDWSAPLRLLAAGQGIADARQRNRLLDATEQRTQALNDAYAQSYDPETGQINQNRLYGMLAQGGQGSVIPQAQQAFSQAQTAAQKARLSNLEEQKTQLDMVGQLLGTVRDPQSWAMARQQAAQMGVPLDGVPEQYDPTYVERIRNMTISAQQQMENQFKQQGLDIQRGRLELETNAPRGQVVDTAQGVMIVDPRSGAARPAQAADGQPLSGQRQAAEQKAQRERRVEAIEAQQAVESSATNLDRLASEARAIMDDPALKRVTGLPGMLPNIPGGNAANVQARLETLKSQVGFAVLQAMRDASKTGGALGNVSNFEVQTLQNNLAALDTSQSPEAFRRSLQQIVDYTQGVKDRLQYAYRQQYGEAQPQQAGQQQSAPVGAPQVGQVEDGWEFLGGDPANPQSWRRAASAPAASGGW